MRKKQNIPKLNLELFFDNYSENLLNVSLAQRKILDVFREKEEELKEYIKQVSVLEKAKNNYKMKDFEKIISNIAFNLGEEFSNLSIPLKKIPILENAAKIKEVIIGIENRGYEFENISNKYTNVKKLWKAFIKPREYIDKQAKFVQIIEEELKELEEQIKDIDIDGIGRIEEKIASIKDLIEKVIYAISELEVLYNKHFFVGYEPLALKKEIERFLEKEYKNKEIGEIVIKTKEILNKKEKLKAKNKTVTEAVNVVLIREKKSKKVKAYGVYINGVYLNPSEIEFKDPEYIFLNRYIYIDNFPVEGIFEKEKLLKNMDISQKQLMAMEKFSQVTMKKFLLEIVGGSVLFWFLYIITPIFNIISFSSTIVGIHFYFAWNFKRLKRKIDKEFGVPNAFYFISINYFYVKEGTDEFKYEKLPYLIVQNFEKVFNFKDREGE